jgi:branched-subunit amino acid aminotransferase/4-amino-4-deoxychorismate lyase
MPEENIKLRIQASSLDEATGQLPKRAYYSTFRTFAACTRVLGLDTHLKRLYEPVPIPAVEVGALRRTLSALLEPYRPDEARVRAVMTTQGKTYLLFEPLTPLPQALYERGVRVKTTITQRLHPQLKSTTFIRRSSSERERIAKAGLLDALLVKDGKILEGITSNFFYVSYAGVLCTAHDDILLGVTRQTVIDIAQTNGLQVKYEPLDQNQITAARESFITSSSRGIVPVNEIDGIRVGEGRPGPITKQLMRAYDLYVLEHVEPI